MEDVLNPYQRSSLRSTLIAFEKSLRSAEAWLNGKQEYGVLYSARLRLSNALRVEALREIRVALMQISKLSQRFQMEKREEDPLLTMRAEMSIAWANLWDSRSQKLARFGNVDEKLAQTLDPDVERLAEIAQRLALFFSNQNSSTDEGDAKNGFLELPR